mmetsp:Transcript_12603/g.17308  ORF Transcript_12603/g.17308 Transcript_12603/m.17308 type:complete len:127 (+) Transcript_12603:92-472(+)
MENKEIETKSLLNLLPCSIEYNGPAPIKSYFQIVESNAQGDESKTLTAHFRGRALRGSQVKLPQSIIGITAVDKHPERVADDGIIKWETLGTFDSINIWEHDVLPNLDQFQECLDWFEISRNVHEI